MPRLKALPCPGPRNGGTRLRKAIKAAPQSFWSTLVGSLKVSFENISSLGESGVSRGDVKVV